MNNNNNEELQFSHIQGYLGTAIEFKLSETGLFNLDSEFGNPYQSYKNLKITHIHLGERVELELETDCGWQIGLIELNEVKPILYPFDLTKEIEYKGEKIIPLEILGKTYQKNGSFKDGFFGWDESTGGGDFQDYYYVVNKYLTYGIFCGHPNDGFSYCIETQNLHIDTVKQFCEWQLDIHGLIEKGLAEIKTIN